MLVIHGQGTKSRLHHRCPHCSGYFAPDYEHFDFAAAAIACPLCAVVWSEPDRHAALNAAVLIHLGQVIVDGVATGAGPDVGTFSLLTTGLDYHMARLDDIAREYRAAKAAEGRLDFSLMRNHMHKVWCRDYEIPEADGQLNAKSLASLSESSTYDKRTVPAWVQFLVMTQDVQGDRHYWEVTGHGPDERWAIIDWGYEFLVPKDAGERAWTKADRIRVLDLIRDKATEGWQVEGGERRMRPVQRGVDIGYLTSEIIAWAQGNPDWKAVRGVGHDEVKDQGGAGSIEKTLPPEIRRTKALRAVRPPGWRIYWYKVDGPHFRRTVHAALLRSADQPGSGMLPRGLKTNTDMILHLLGEIWTEPKDGETFKAYWREVRQRHDYLDCTVYALALALLHRYAPDRRDDGDAMPPEPPEPQPPPGWVSEFTGGEPWV